MNFGIIGAIGWYCLGLGIHPIHPNAIKATNSYCSCHWITDKVVNLGSSRSSNSFGLENHIVKKIELFGYEGLKKKKTDQGWLRLRLECDYTKKINRIRVYDHYL